MTQTFHGVMHIVDASGLQNRSTTLGLITAYALTGMVVLSAMAKQQVRIDLY
jgi:hypothetical protein